MKTIPYRNWTSTAPKCVDAVRPMVRSGDNVTAGPLSAPSSLNADTGWLSTLLGAGGALFGVLLAVAGFLTYRWYSKRQFRHDLAAIQASAPTSASGSSSPGDSGGGVAAPDDSSAVSFKNYHWNRVRIDVDCAGKSPKIVARCRYITHHCTECRLPRALRRNVARHRCRRR